MAMTPEQQAIVDARGGDVFVTAGAGSGKTTALVERYVGLLSECGIREIAAVTFTDAAATEMRERVRREVLSREDLKRHRPDLDAAVIGTIHSLCLRLLREHPVESAIDPAARVLPEDEAESELLSACVEALEEAASADDRKALALREIGVYALTVQLPQMIARRDEAEAAYRAMGDGPAEWARKADALVNSRIETVVERARPQLAEWASSLKGALAAATGTDALSPRVTEVLRALGDPDKGDWQDLSDRIRRAGASVNLTGGSNRNWANLDGVKERMGSIRDEARRLDGVPQWNEYDEPALEALDSLRALFDDACARYAKRKKELAALDYLDLELEATKLLRSRPDVAASYRARFRHLMVDELQDTNPAQVALLDLLSQDLLSRDGAAPLPGPERLFVGDVKQAIYRFRGSDVRHFARLHGDVRSTGNILSLSQSFRAHNPLVETFNVVFHHVFADAREEFEAPMQTMTGRGPEAPPGPHLVLMPVAAQSQTGERTSDMERRQAEANEVASEIAALLQRGAPVWGREERAFRPARASDVAVLLRRLANVHLFEMALESHIVPYRTPAGAGFFTRQEVRDLTNLLGWLAEPDDIIALVGALRSPLFMIDDQSLLALRSERNLLQALHDPPPGVLDEARPFCAHAAAVLDELRLAARTAASDTLIETALTRTGFEASWAPLQGGDQTLANIRKFVGLARTLADHSLDEFVTYVVRRRDELEAREGQAVLDASDAVRLMTVHGAKGLEFPIVFVPEAHLSSRASYDYVRWRSGEGVSATLAREIGDEARRRPAFYSYLIARDEEEEAAEHKRLFYVAATRAADTLYVSGDESKSGVGWLAAATAALGTAPRDGVEVRSPLIVGPGARARRPPLLTLPSPDAEEDFMPPLVARPRVIPLRSSTPATALRPPAAPQTLARHGDGLGLVRGNLAHRAIELWFTTGTRPALADLVRRMDASVDDQAAEHVAADVDAMLDRLDASPLAATLRDRDTLAYFELPFSWDWNGAPVHGTIDLAYRSAGNWRVLDFKTDEISGKSLAEAAAPYLPQLALYASALERATRRPPLAGLLFLRTGDVYSPAPADLDAALDATRARIDEGQTIEDAPPSPFDDPEALYGEA